MSEYLPKISLKAFSKIKFLKERKNCNHMTETIKLSKKQLKKSMLLNHKLDKFTNFLLILICQKSDKISEWQSKIIP